MAPNKRLHLLGEGRLLQIRPTQVADSGRYLCVATNVAGEDDQDFNVLIQGVWGGHGWPGWVRRASGLWSGLAGNSPRLLFPFPMAGTWDCPTSGLGSFMN